MNLHNRAIRPRLLERARGKLGRLVVLTGARQTGKTTLVRLALPDVTYVSLEDPAVRPAFSRMSALELRERSKSPKVHVLDPGILRVLSNRTGELTGEEFESAVVSEIWKQIRSAGLRIELFHLRTYDRREVDLLLELETGFVPIQIKKALRVAPTDARSLHDLNELLDKPILHSFVLSFDRDARELSPGVHALPVAWALGPPDP